MMETSRLSGMLLHLGPLEVKGSLMISVFLTIILAAIFGFYVLSRFWKGQQYRNDSDARRTDDQSKFLERQEPSISTWEAILEAIYQTMENSVGEIVGTHGQQVFPFVATMWIFILLANLIGLIPGLSSPTSDLSITGALAFLVFSSVHWFGIRIEGWKSYLRHYLSPSPILLPFHLISEVSRSLALAIRLFGNVMSLEMAAFLVVMVAGLLVPIPILALHIVEAVIQAYLFGILTLIYIAGALQSQERRRERKGDPQWQI